MTEPCDPPGDQWWTWIDVMGARRIDLAPWNHELVEIWRKEWGNETQFIRPADMPPAMNVAGLLWRPA